VGPRCFNQLVRPKISLPTWSLEPGHGNCATCKSCPRNKDCVGFIPVPGLFCLDIECDDEDVGEDD